MLKQSIHTKYLYSQKTFFPRFWMSTWYMLLQTNLKYPLSYVSEYNQNLLKVDNPVIRIKYMIHFSVTQLSNFIYPT